MTQKGTYGAQDDGERLPVGALIDHQPQRQDSTTSQLVTVLAAAIRLGCYDAHDAIRAAFFDREQAPATGRYGTHEKGA